MAHSTTQTRAAEERAVREHTNIGGSQWPGPGVFVRVEFGVAFSPAKAKRLSWGYASKNMNTSNQQHPPSLVPGNGCHYEVGASALPPQDRDEIVHPRRRRIRSRSALQLRTSPISPVSVLSPEEFQQRDSQEFYTEPVFEQVFHPSPAGSMRSHRPAQGSQSTHRPSPVSQYSYPGLNGFTYPAPPLHSSSYPPPQTPQASSSSSSSSRLPPFAAIRQSTIDRKPLPPLPSRFRLGEDDLPWSSPTWIPSSEHYFAEPTSLSLGSPELRYASPELRYASPESRFAESARRGSPARGSPARGSPARGSPARAPGQGLLGTPSDSPRRRDSPAETARRRGSPAGILRNEPSTRDEDPQRNRDLGQLHQAMLGIDSISLGNDWWEPDGSFDRLGELGGLPRGPRGLGWAVAVPTRDSAEQREERSNAPQQDYHPPPQSQHDHYLSNISDIDPDPSSPPPAYTQGQWGWDWEWEERSGYWVRGLRRSSSVR